MAHSLQRLCQRRPSLRRWRKTARKALTCRPYLGWHHRTLLAVRRQFPPELQVRIDQLNARLGASEEQLVLAGRFSDEGFFVREEGGEYLLCYFERGKVDIRHRTSSVDDLLYRFFESVTASMALAYELRHRVPGQDFRRVAFARQEELLGEMFPEWADRCKQEHAAILRQSPFRDG